MGKLLKDLAKGHRNGGRKPLNPDDAAAVTARMVHLIKSVYQHKTTKTIANELQVSGSSVSGWSKGTVPDQAALVALGRVYHVNLNWVLLDEGKPLRRGYIAHGK